MQGRSTPTPLWSAQKVRLEKGRADLLRLEHGYDLAGNLTRTIESPGNTDLT
jgi:hypothetical protein